MQKKVTGTITAQKLAILGRRDRNDYWECHQHRDNHFGRFLVPSQHWQQRSHASAVWLAPRILSEKAVAPCRTSNVSRNHSSSVVASDVTASRCSRRTMRSCASF